MVETFGLGLRLLILCLVPSYSSLNLMQWVLLPSPFYR